MKDYQKLFSDLIEHLLRITDIEVSEAKLAPPADENDLNEIEKKLMISIAESTKAFYRQIGSVAVSWAFKTKIIDSTSGSHTVRGRINILPVREVFMGYDDRGWEESLWFEHMKPALKNELKRLRPFEIFDDDDTGCVCFRVNQNVMNNDLTLYSVDNGLNKIRCDLEAYLDLLLCSSGLFRWQYLLTKNSFNLSNSLFKTTMEEFLPKVLFQSTQEEFFRKIERAKGG